MEAARYKQKLNSTLDELKKLGCNEKEIGALKEEVNQTSDLRQLALMFQSLREVLDKESGGKGEAEFAMSTKDGRIIKAKNLEDAERIANEYHSNKRRNHPNT